MDNWICPSYKRIISSFKIKTEVSNQTSNIDNLSKADIAKIVEGELNKIDASILERYLPLSANKLNLYIKNDVGLRIENLDNSSTLLGSYDIKNKLIRIHPSILNSSRYLFVLSHELGHFLIHKNVQMSQVEYESFSDPEFNFRANKYEFNNPRHWIEWQANYFATSLILPKEMFIFRVNFFQKRYNYPIGRIYLDDKPNNRRIFSDLVKHLAYFFDVSKTSVIFRLKELELINDQTRLKSIGQLINEYEADLFG